MLKVLFGEKGAGKTKRIINEANELLTTANGTLIFIDDDKSNTRDINYKIRFVDASEYSIDSPKMFYGFICGLAAQDFDLQAIFIDGFHKIVGSQIEKYEELFLALDKFSTKFKVDISISINSDAKCAPDYLKVYLV